MVRRPRHNDKNNDNSVVQGNDNDSPETGPAGAPIVPMSLPLAGRVPEGEWARRACFVRMISMSPASGGSSRYVLGDAFTTIASKRNEIDPELLVLPG